MKQANRILSFLLALVMLLGLLPVGSIPTANAATDEFGVENEGYIDLPIQTMDFLGDGLLFQSSDCFKSNFSLTNMSSSSHSPESVTVVDDNENQVTAKFPGEQSHKDYAADLNGNGDAFRILGLIEDQLIGGKIVYTDATVTYIAYSLKERGRYFPSMPSTTGTRVNHAFADLVNTDIPLGTLNDTYKKCGGKGGDLLWTDVETCFDLAYYMLHYVWHPVSKTKSNVLFEDSYNNNTFPVYYNIDVDELQRIRLYKKNVDGQDLYVFDSGENKDNGDIIEGISNGTIYSTQQTQDSSKNELTFTALDRKGYESDAYYGEACNTNGKWDGGSTPNNYCFTIRAKGAFVFWKESDLFFEFSGDDDVYFYINDQLVCDIGGIHGRRVDYVYLNELVEAGEIDLEDGQICTFDMFYAERHTTGINLKLSTNIELMDYDLLTQKKQFDARTGLEYANGQAVPYGTPIDYQFSVLNRKTLPASEVSFVDENLGVELSREKIKVSGSTEYVGSADISGEGLEVIYRPYNDDGSLSTEGMVTVDSLEALRSSIAPFTEKLTLSEGKPPRIRTPYRYAVKTAEELRTILGIGVPGYCEFAVYGIERTLQKAGSATGDRIILANSNHIYSNTLRSTARPGTIREGEANVTVFYASPVNGISTCRIKGFDMGDVAAVEPLRIVVDYGKAVDIRLGTFADGADYKKVDYSLEYVGMELPAENEATSKMGLVTRTLPENLLFTAAGDTEIQGENGSFTRTDEAIRFTMNGFLEAVERAYAVLSVTPLNDPESGEPATGNEIIGYIYVELQIVPANMMYYEAEDFTDSELAFEEKGSEAEPDYLFFDFDGSGADLQMNSSIYGNTNWDTVDSDGTTLKYWTGYGNGKTVTLQKGESTVAVGDISNGFGLSINKGTGKPKLSYTIQTGDFVEVRIKGEKLSEGKINFYAQEGPSASITNAANVTIGSTDDFINDEFVLMSKEVSKDMVGKTLTGIDIRGRLPSVIATDVYIDYIYIGPADKAPSALEARGVDRTAVLSKGLNCTWTYKTDEDIKKETAGGMSSVKELSTQDATYGGQAVYIPDYSDHPEVLFYGFDNRPEDRERYLNHSGYGGRGINYDDPDQVSNNWYVYKERNGQPRRGKVKDIQIDGAAGTMVVTALDQCYGTSGTGDLWPDVYIDTIYEGDYFNRALSYNPEAAEVYQIRFKMENFRIGTDGNEENSKEVLPGVLLQYQHVGQDLSETKDPFESTAEGLIHTELLNANEYVVMTMFTSEDFRKSEELKKIRIFFHGLESISATQLGKLTIDYVYIGPYDLAPVEAAYGRDSSYADDALLSDGESLYIEGKGTRPKNDPNPEAYSEVKFSFTGTGFDLLARTGAEQTIIRVDVYTDPERTVWKQGGEVWLKGEMELYQVPMASIQDLPYGTYYITIGVMYEVKYSNPFLQGLNHGNQFYFDALRIYDPIDVSAGESADNKDSKDAYAAYCADREAYPVIKEVRDIILSAKDFDALDGSTIGAVFVDYAEEPVIEVPETDAEGETTGETENIVDPDLDIDNHITGSIVTYEKVGPNNEVYLGPQQMLVFKLVVESQVLPKRLDIGCKALDGGNTYFKMILAEAAGDTRQTASLPVYTATPMYYTMPLWDGRFTPVKDSEGNITAYEVYVMISNTASKTDSRSGVLSITDVKVAFDRKPVPMSNSDQPAAYTVESAKRTAGVELPLDEFVKFMIDGNASQIVEDYLDSMETENCEHIPGALVVETPAAPGQEGLGVRYCVRCGEICYTQSFAALGELTFTGASVTLQSDLSIQFKVLESLFTEQGYADPYVVVVDRNGVETVIREYTVKDGKYSFIYKNIAPHRIGDTITATLYATYNGELYCSAPIEYSVARYCYNMLGKTEGNAAFDKLRTLLVDILHYGAESQRYTGYRTEDLCNSGLTPEQLACGTELTRELVNHRDLEHEVVENPTVHWKGAGLNLQESVAIRFRLEAESYEDLEVRVTLAGQTFKFRSEDFDYRADGTFVHFTYLNAAQLSEPVYITAYRDGVQVSNTLCYSVESYAYSKQTVTTIPYLASLVERMMCYGDSAKAYVG